MSKLLTALEALRDYVRAAHQLSEARPLTRSPWTGFSRQYPDLARVVNDVVAATPGTEPHLGHIRLAQTFAATGGPSYPYIALAFDQDASKVVAFRPLRSLDDPAGFEFTAEHKSPEHARTVLVCAVVAG